MDGVSASPLGDAHLVYNAHEILFVGSGSAAPSRDILNPGQDAPDVHLPNATAFPGLIEAHAHLFLDGGELDFDARKAHLAKSPDQLLEEAKGRLEGLLRMGVVGVRDAGDKDGVGLALSRLYRSKDRPLMPYVDSPGAAIHRKGRYGSFMSEPLENHVSLDACVEDRVQAGAYRIKLIPTGIINFKKGAVTSEPQMSTEEVAEIVRAAKARGKQTFAHASGDVGIDIAIEGGVDSVEHGFFVRDDQLAKMRDRNIAWIPTIAPVQRQVDLADRMGWDEEIVGNLQRILDGHAGGLAKANQLGVQIIAGSDAGSYAVAHGTDFLYELELMEASGLSPLTVINAATGVSSNRLGYWEPIGRLAPGYLNRFVVTEYSPLEKIGNLRKPRTTVYHDRVLSGSLPG